LGRTEGALRHPGRPAAPAGLYGGHLQHHSLQRPIAPQGSHRRGPRAWSWRLYGAV